MSFFNEEEVRESYRKITLELIEKGRTVSTMESCTSGLIASLITDTEGASAVLKGAFVTYSNVAKIMQGVPKEIIEKYSVYSKETAASMAEACRKTYGADYGIGVTGTMGNIDPVSVLRHGDPAKVREATLSLLEKCSKHKNFLISSGCDIPPATPWENIDAFFAAVEEFYNR